MSCMKTNCKLTCSMGTNWLSMHASYQHFKLNSKNAEHSFSPYDNDKITFVKH